ncbi:hypothetical protein KAW64_12775 [bacterium]|jgi:hypothetical protein|nr:hypothetical protein [bacterium]
MDIVQQFNALIWSWAETLRALRRRVGVRPLLIYAAVQLVVLVMLALFAYPPFVSFVMPLIRWRLGEAAMHYPGSFLALRAIFGQVDMVLTVVLGGFVTGAAVWLFSVYYGGGDDPPATGFRVAAKRYIPVLVIALIGLAIAQIVTRVPMGLWGYLADERPMRFRLLRMATIGMVMVVQSLLVYAIPYVILGSRRVWSALGASLSLAVRNPITTFLIVAVPAALELLPAWLSRNSTVIMYRFAPEGMMMILAVWIAVIFFVTYLMVGAATRFYIYATQDDAEVGDAAEV